LSIESLHKLDHEWFDGDALVVIDEAPLAFQRLISETVTNNRSLEVFHYALKSAQSILLISADTDLHHMQLAETRLQEQCEFRLMYVERLREDEGRSVCIVDGKYEKVVVATMIKFLNEGVPFAVACASKTTAEALSSQLNNALCITSNSKGSEIEQAFSDPVSCLVYTSKLGAGTSIEIPDHFKYVFLWCSPSLTVEAHKQLATRVRSYETLVVIGPKYTAHNKHVELNSNKYEGWLMASDFDVLMDTISNDDIRHYISVRRIIKDLKLHLEDIYASHLVDQAIKYNSLLPSLYFHLVDDCSFRLTTLSSIAHWTGQEGNIRSSIGSLTKEQRQRLGAQVRAALIQNRGVIGYCWELVRGNPTGLEASIKEVLKVFAFLCGTEIDFDFEASDAELPLIDDILRVSPRQYLRHRARWMTDVLKQEPLLFNSDQNSLVPENKLRRKLYNGLVGPLLSMLSPRMPMVTHDHHEIDCLATAQLLAKKKTKASRG
jgi:hypothetical protein